MGPQGGQFHRRVAQGASDCASPTITPSPSFRRSLHLYNAVRLKPQPKLTSRKLPQPETPRMKTIASFLAALSICTTAALARIGPAAASTKPTQAAAPATTQFTPTTFPTPAELIEKFRAAK